VSVTDPPWQKVVGPFAVTAGVAGLALTVTVVAVLVAVQPFAFATVTLKLPEAFTTIDCVVAPFDQRYEALAGAVSVTEPPWQKVVGPFAVTTGVAGAALTVTVVAALVAVQPFAFVTVTLCEPDVFTRIDCVVAPFDQRYEALAGAVSVTEPPWQKVVGPLALTTGVAGSALTVTAVAALVALQPFAFVTVTLYEPDALATIDCVVAPVDQRYEALAGAVSVTEPPSQNDVGPLALTTGVAGSALTVTAVAALVALQPFAFVTVTLYEPDAFTTIDCVVAPVDQRCEALAGAVSVTEPPSQNDVGPLALTTGVAGSALTVTAVAALVALQAFALVTVTPYEPDAVATIDCVAAPFDQR
jgi:hypothetical protein